MTYAALNADQRGGSSATGKPSLTLDAAAANLTREGLSWSAGLGQPTVVTYAFRASAPGTMPSDTSGFQQFNASQISATEQALQLWAQVANIQFVRVGSGYSGSGAYSDNATILFGAYTAGEEGASGFGYLPGNRSSGSAAGDVWVNDTLDYIRSPQGSAGFGVLLHEIGHAIGLAHPSDYDASATVQPTYAANASYNEDSLEYTVMSYFNLSNTGGSVGSQILPSAPLMDDIAAAQRLYGANTQAATGNTVYGSNPYVANAGFYTAGSILSSVPYGTIWDAGGIDSLDFGYSSYSERIDLHPGSFSDVQGNVGTLSIAPGVIIENAVGGYANDTIDGNDVNNQLEGNDGDDTLIGERGDDLLIGGNGSDRAVIKATFAAATFEVSGNGDIVVNSQDGRDTLRTIESIAFSDRTISTSLISGTDAMYRTYMGRGVVPAELAYWLGLLVAGQPLSDVRSAILADSFGHAHTLSTIDGFYHTYMGRSAVAAEFVYWEGQVKAGVDFDTVRYYIAADWSARPYIDQQIDQSYRIYMGRSATPAEINIWHDQIVAGTTANQFHAVLASDAGAQHQVVHLVADAYAFGMSREPTLAETNHWVGELRAGVPVEVMQQYIADASPIPGQSAGTVTATYQMYMGRAPYADELSYWDGQARAGTSLTSLREAILNDSFGQAHTVGFLNSLYDQYFHRAPAPSEIQAWTQTFGQGTTLDTARATLYLDGGSIEAQHYDASPMNSVTVMPRDMGHSIVSGFHNIPAGLYYGVSGPGDVDVLDLRAAPVSGNPLNYAREIVELNGTHDVLISYDAHHEILLQAVTMAQLTTANFLFA